MDYYLRKAERLLFPEMLNWGVGLSEESFAGYLSDPRTLKPNGAGGCSG